MQPDSVFLDSIDYSRRECLNESLLVVVRDQDGGSSVHVPGVDDLGELPVLERGLATLLDLINDQKCRFC